MRLAEAEPWHANLFDFQSTERALGGRMVTDIPCPLCSPWRQKHNQKKRVLRVWRISDRLIGYNCIHCDSHGTLWNGDDRRMTEAEIERRREVFRQQRERERQEEEKRRRQVEMIWTNARPGRGTLAERYFIRRGLDVPSEVWPLIRFEKALFFGAVQYLLPAVVIPATTVRGDDLSAVHLIALCDDGSNVRHDGKNLKILRGRMHGAAIKLAPLRGDTLCVCEGFETALGVIMGNVNERAPVWALTGSTFLGAFELPYGFGIRRIIVAADNDKPDRKGHRAGIEAGERLASHARAKTVIRLPIVEGSDFDDQYRKQ